VRAISWITEKNKLCRGFTGEGRLKREERGGVITCGLLGYSTFKSPDWGNPWELRGKGEKKKQRF